MSGPLPNSNRPGLSLVLPVIGLVCVGAGLAAWRWLTPGPVPPDAVRHEPDSPPPDPRLTFQTEFRNVRPEVKYVGDAACARCHTRIAQTFREHPMGRSAEWVTKSSAVDHAAGANNPCTASVYGLRVERKGDAVWHHATPAGRAKGDASLTYSVPAELAIGSGTIGRSYLNVDRARSGSRRVSWFAGSVGYVARFEGMTDLRRPVAHSACCHTAQPSRAGLIKPLQGAVSAAGQHGCERCHGPGTPRRGTHRGRRCPRRTTRS